MNINAGGHRDILFLTHIDGATDIYLDPERYINPDIHNR